MTKKIVFTDKAKDQIQKITSESKSKKYFRISVKGGWNSDRWNFNNHITKKKMGSSVRGAQAYKEKDNLSKKSKQTEITYWEVLPGDRIGVSSMIGASKLISKYRKFFNPKDIDFLLNRKKYSGEQTEIRPIKKFYLNREDQDKYNHLLDKNDHIIFPC